MTRAGSKETYSKEDLEKVRGSVPVEDFLLDQGYDIDSSNMTTCVSHDDSKPSMWVSDEICYCHVCGESWDIFDTAQKELNTSFKPTVDYLVEEYAINLTGSPTNGTDMTEVKKERKKVATAKTESISKAQYEAIISNTSPKGSKYRGISDATLKKSGVRTEYNDNGEVVARYYPAIENDKLVGYKKRVCDKELLKRMGKEKHFISFGRVGNSNDLYGARFYKGSTKTLFIVGGEEDREAMVDMINSLHFKSNWSKPAVVSCSTGEGSLKNQIKNNYKFINQFETIVLALDSDKAGIAAMEECALILPKGKVWLTKWSSYKDPNEYLINNDVALFIKEHFDRHKWIPDGIVGSSTLLSSIKEEIQREKIPLPPFMSVLSKMMAGGMPLGYIVNIAALPGVGKTSLINEVLYHMFYNSPYMTTVLSMELSKGQYGIATVSRHLGKKLNLMEDPEEAMQFLIEHDAEIQGLLKKEDGSDRFTIIDNRDFTIEEIKEKVLEVIKTLGSKVIVCDPLTDLLEAQPNEVQEDFMSWQKSITVSENVTFVNICHFRKQADFDIGKKNKKDPNSISFPDEQAIKGSGAIIQSGGANILLARNKLAEDPVERNTIHAIMPKCRWTGNTGLAGRYYYDNETHTMMERNIYDARTGEREEYSPEEDQKEPSGAYFQKAEQHSNELNLIKEENTEDATNETTS